MGTDTAKKRFAVALDAFLHRSPLSTREITLVARRNGIGYSTLQSWRTGHHLPRVPEDNPNLVTFLGEVAAAPPDARHVLELAKQAWRRAVEAKKRPVGAPSFVGRAGQRAVLRSHLGESGGVVVVWGPSGIGKTALAREVVRDVLDGGQLLTVDLTGSGEPLAVRQALIELLTPGVSGDVGTLRMAYAALAGARRTVLLLDDAANSAQVLPLLEPLPPGCVTIITSRDPLAELEERTGALRLRLGPLQPGESRELLSSALTANDAEVAALAELCRHEPLALQVVVGQLRSPAGPSIGEYLRGGREGALVANAYRDLPEGAREVFELVTLSPGKDITAWTTAAMAGVSRAQATGLLELLERAQFVRCGHGRYSVHDTLRLFGQEQAARRGEAWRRAGLGRLSAHYTHTTMAAAGTIFPEVLPLLDAEVGTEFATEREASAWLVAERHNLVALDALAADDPALTLALANALRASHQVRPHGVDWTPIAERARARATTPKAQAAMCVAAGMAQWAVGRLDVASDRLEEAVRQYRTLRDPRARSAALLALGAVEHALGRLRQGREHSEEALRVRRRLGAVRGQSSALVYLSEVCIDLGELTEAAAHAAEALELAEQTDYTAGTAGALGNLGRVLVEQGRFDEAHEAFHRQLALADELDFRSRKPIALVGLALLSHRRHLHEQAIERAVEAASIAVGAGNTVARVDAWNVAGAAHLGRGRYTESESCHRKAFDAATAAHHLRGRTEALIGMSRAARPHDPHRALELAQDAVRLARESEFRVLDAPAGIALMEAMHAIAM